jgi:hypothetical protein
VVLIDLVAPRVARSALRLAAGLSARDRRILSRAGALLGGTSPDFSDALRAVRQAVEEQIPCGRLFHLGAGASGPIIGSLVSGVGITPAPAGVLVVRVDRSGRLSVLGDLAP